MPVPTTFAVANLYKKRLLAGVELDRRPMLLRTLASLVFRSNGKTVEESINDLENNKANKSDLGTVTSLDVPESGNANANQVVKGNDTRLTDARVPLEHTQPSNTINAMTGYTKSSARSSPIIQSDSLNSAIGKLERSIDDFKQTPIIPVNPSTIPTEEGAIWILTS